jgi:hypothetical protein
MGPLNIKSLIMIGADGVRVEIYKDFKLHVSKNCRSLLDNVSF